MVKLKMKNIMIMVFNVKNGAYDGRGRWSNDDPMYISLSNFPYVNNPESYNTQMEINWLNSNDNKKTNFNYMYMILLLMIKK